MPRPKSRTIRDLAGHIVSVESKTGNYKYPSYGMTLAEGWVELAADIERMRNVLGQVRTDQLLDMLSQAQKHYQDAYAKSPVRPDPGDAGFEDIKLGTRLMQDIEWVARGRAPFAYPVELYRWPIIPGSKDAGDPDLDGDFVADDL